MNRSSQTPWRALALLATVPLAATHAQAQGPTVTPLPYLLTNKGGVIIKLVFTVVSASQSPSGVDTLLGGGLASAFSTSAGPAEAAAIASVRAVLEVKKANMYVNHLNQVKQDANKAEMEIKQQQAEDEPSCEDFKAAISNHKFKAADAPVCMLPEEEKAAQSEEDLEALTESGEAAEAEVEGAEAAAEAAEVAAEAAVASAEAAVEAAEALEAILELAGFF